MTADDYLATAIWCLCWSGIAGSLCVLVIAGKRELEERIERNRR